MTSKTPKTETEEFEASESYSTSNEYDAYVAMCRLVSEELTRVHKKLDDYEAESSVFQSQAEMLAKLQARVMELTTPE